MLRVGLDYRPALLDRSGIARSVAELANALARIADVDLRLFGHSWSHPLAGARSRVPAGARLHRTRLPGRALAPLARLGIGAERLAGAPAVFHWTDYVHPPIGAGVASVLTIHDLAFADDPSFHGAESTTLLERTRRAAARADRIVTPSVATAAAIRRHLPEVATDPTRIDVVPFGSDHARVLAGARRPPHPRSGEPFVLALGTIEPRKNHARLLAAWRGLPDATRPRLVVIGKPGWESAAVEAELERSAGDALTWLRDADDDTVFAHLAHATALAYPSLVEGFGFPPLEAMALGTPVVVGDTPALRELVADAAHVCDPSSVESIRAGLLAVVADDEERARLAAAGPRRAEAFSWRSCAERHVAIYRDAIAARQR